MFRPWTISSLITTGSPKKKYKTNDMAFSCIIHFSEQKNITLFSRNKMLHMAFNLKYIGLFKNYNCDAL